MRRIQRVAVAMGLLAVAALSVTIALHSGDNPGIAYAITPTPDRFTDVWEGSLKMQGRVVLGSTVKIAVHVSLRDGEEFPYGVFDQVSYELVTTNREDRDGDPVLELVSDKLVTVDDFSEGAEWELLASARGLMDVSVVIHVQFGACPTCERFDESRRVARRPITVAMPAGDANCNFEVNSIDAALILQFDAGIIAELPCPKEADVNDTLTADALDAFAILQYAVGFLDTLDDRFEILER